MFFLSMFHPAVAGSLSLSDLAEGDIIVSEVMAAPAATAWYRGEWIELINTTAYTVDLDGLRVSAGAYSTEILGELLAAPGEAIVLATRSNAALNGGIEGVDYQYDIDDLRLVDRAQDIALSYDGTTFDEISLSVPSSGASWSLDPDMANADDNDSGDSWCVARYAYGYGDLGSPGEENSHCALSADELITGDLTLSELMASPLAAPWYRGQWIELANHTAHDIDLNGVTLSDRTGEQTFSTEAIVPAGGLAVVAARDNATANGGIEGVIATFDITLFAMASTRDSVTLSAGETVLDAVAWDADSGAEDGASWSWDGSEWCPAHGATYGDGDAGTPGEQNNICDADADGSWAIHDCDDNNAEVYVGALDTTRDGIDQDCSGADWCTDPDVVEFVSINHTSRNADIADLCDGFEDGLKVGHLEVTSREDVYLGCICSVDTLTVERLSSDDMSSFSTTTVNNELYLSSSAVASLEGLTLSSEMETIQLDDVTLLSDMSGLASVRTIEQLLLFDLPENIDFSATNAWERVDNLSFSTLHEDTDWTGLGWPSTISGSIDISGYIVPPEVMGSFQGIQTLDSLSLYLTELVSLEGFEGLVTLGELNLQQNVLLEDLTGLNNVEYIGTLYAYANPALENTNGLDSVQAGGVFTFYDNDELVSLSGLDSLETLETLEIRESPAFESMSGLSNLITLDTLNLVRTEAFQHFNALHNLESLNNLAISWSTGDLSSLAVLGKITEMDSVEIYSSYDLDLSVFSNLTSIGDLCLETNSTSLYGFHKLTEADNIIMMNMVQLSDFSGFSSLERVHGDFAGGHFGYNDKVKDMSGLEKLTYVGGHFGFYNFISIENLNGLSSLQHVGECFAVHSSGFIDLTGLSAHPDIDCLDIQGSTYSTKGMEFLTSIDGPLTISGEVDLSGLSNLQSVGSIEFRNVTADSLEEMSSLTTVNNGLFISSSTIDTLSFPSLESVGAVWLLDNSGLTSLGAMPALASVGVDTRGTSLYLHNNDDLIDISSLESISEVEGSVYLGDNDVLGDLLGLQNLSAVGGDLTIRHNSSLSDEQIETFVSGVAVQGGVVIE